MDKAAKARQRAHQTRRQNEKRKQRIKEASEAYHYKEPQPQYRSFVPPMSGHGISIAAAEMLFSRAQHGSSYARLQAGGSSAHLSARNQGWIMSDFQLAVSLMCVMGIVFVWFTKLMFDAFIIHLRRQSDLTTAAVKQAGDAVELNGRILATLASLAGAPAILPHDGEKP